jgi:uncharacterized membrane protein YraQ (UPF0718 family)
MEIIIALVIATVVIGALAYFVVNESNEETLDKPVETPTVDNKKETKSAAKKSSAAPKTTSKKKTAVNFDSMTKTQLLEHAKKNGVKVNASMKKADIVSKIKNA